MGGTFLLAKSNRSVGRKIAYLERNEPEVTYGVSSNQLLPKNVLVGYLDQELSRRRGIEDKAKTNALAIAVAFSAMLVGVGFASRWVGTNDPQEDWMIWFVVGLQIVGILFLLTGGLFALSALRIAKTYMWVLADDQKYMTAEAINVKLSWRLEVNQHITLLKSNLVHASYGCIRNGVIAFALAALSGTVIWLVPSIPTGC